MKTTNVAEHFRIGIIAGIVAGMVMPILRLETLWSAVIKAAFILMVLFELWQKIQSTNPNYLKLKWLDCICDIVAGWIGFSVPVAVMCLSVIGMRLPV